MFKEKRLLFKNKSNGAPDAVGGAIPVEGAPATTLKVTPNSGHLARLGRIMATAAAIAVGSAAAACTPGTLPEPKATLLVAATEKKTGQFEMRQDAKGYYSETNVSTPDFKKGLGVFASNQFDLLVIRKFFKKYPQGYTSNKPYKAFGLNLETHKFEETQVSFVLMPDGDFKVYTSSPNFYVNASVFADEALADLIAENQDPRDLEGEENKIQHNMLKDPLSASMFRNIVNMGFFQKYGNPHTWKNFPTRKKVLHAVPEEEYQGVVDLSLDVNGMFVVTYKGGYPQNIDYYYLLSNIELSLTEQKDCQDEVYTQCATADGHRDKGERIMTKTEMDDAPEDRALIEKAVNGGTSYDFDLKEISKALETAGIMHKRVVIFYQGKPLVLLPDSSKIIYSGSLDTNQKDFKDLMDDYMKNPNGFPLSSAQERQRVTYEGGRSRPYEISGSSVAALQKMMDDAGVPFLEFDVSSDAGPIHIIYERKSGIVYTKNSPKKEALTTQELESGLFGINEDKLLQIATANLISNIEKMHNIQIVTNAVPSISGVKAGVLKDPKAVWQAVGKLNTSLAKYPKEVGAKWHGMKVYLVSGLQDKSKPVPAKRDHTSIALDVSQGNAGTVLDGKLFSYLDGLWNDAEDTKRAEAAAKTNVPGNYYSTNSAWVTMETGGIGKDYFGKLKGASDRQEALTVRLLDPVTNAAERAKMATDPKERMLGESLTGFKFDPTKKEFTTTTLTQPDYRARGGQAGPHYFGLWAADNKGTIAMPADVWNNPASKIATPMPLPDHTGFFPTQINALGH